MKMSIHLTVGQKLELDCTSSGNPPPKVTWRRIDGPKLNEDRTIQHNKGLLSMHGVGQADRGKYQCFASNSLGNDSRTFLVDVRGKHYKLICNLRNITVSGILLSKNFT